MKILGIAHFLELTFRDWFIFNFRMSSWFSKICWQSFEKQKEVKLLEFPYPDVLKPNEWHLLPLIFKRRPEKGFAAKMTYIKPLFPSPFFVYFFFSLFLFFLGFSSLLPTPLTTLFYLFFVFIMLLAPTTTCIKAIPPGFIGNVDTTSKKNMKLTFLHLLFFY